MIVSILLQISPLLPAPLQKPYRLANNSSYQEKVLNLAKKSEWKTNVLKELRPTNTSEENQLAELLPYSTFKEAQLVAVLASDANGDSLLGDSLLQLAFRSHDSATQVACLLAPKNIPAKYSAVMAELALQTHKSLAIRFLACGRLIESGQFKAWILAKRFLLTGTSQDHNNNFPDWRRNGKYELAKRLLWQHIATIVTPYSFEPNAPWAEQERQVEQIDSVFIKKIQNEFAPKEALGVINSHPMREQILRLIMVEGE